MNRNTGRMIGLKGFAAGTLLAVPMAEQVRFYNHRQPPSFPECLCVYNNKYKDNSMEIKPDWHKTEQVSREAMDVVKYTKTSFRYDQYSYINFYEPFMLKFVKGYVLIGDWGISFPCQSIGEFDKCLVRYLQDLMEKALDNRLAEHEKKEWLTMLEHFDYNQFRLDYSPALYEEFKIASIDYRGKKVVLLRQDGKRTTCQITVSPSFSNGRFKKGDVVGAMVKRNHRDSIMDMTGERIIHDELNSDEAWNKIKVI